MKHLLGVATLLCSLSNAVACQSSSAPVARQVTVEPGVNLEVLDYGGSGRAVVLLGGYGRTAHDFDTFGPVLAANFHTYAITRRGFRGSSRPDSGYSADRLADDVLAVIDSLGLVQPIVAAHSLGGEELSSIGSRHPTRVAGLVYLDAAYGYAFYDRNDTENRAFVDPNEVIRGLRQLTVAREAGNAEEAHRLLARLLDTDIPALRETLQDIRQRTPQVSASPRRGLVMRLSPGVDRGVFEGLQRFTRVNAPILAIFALKGSQDQGVLRAWNDGTRPELVALRSAAPQAQVVVLPTASHDVFKSHPAEVITAITNFARALPSKG